MANPPNPGGPDRRGLSTSKLKLGGSVIGVLRSRFAPVHVIRSVLSAGF